MKGFETYAQVDYYDVVYDSKKECPAMKGFETLWLSTFRTEFSG